MRIVYCINGLFNMGGIERVVSNKANYLVSRGYEVHIVTTEQMNWPLAFPLNSKVTCHDLGINYSSRVHSSYIAKIYHYLRNTLLHKYRLRNLLLNLKPDIVISTFGYESYLLPSIKGESSKILEFHFSYAMFQKAQKRRGVLGFFDKFLTRRMLNAIKRYDRFVVLTRRDSLDWYKWYECDNIEIIPNAQTFACESPAPLDNKKVIAVGRYTYEKGFDRLVQAWELVNLKTQG